MRCGIVFLVIVLLTGLALGEESLAPPTGPVGPIVEMPATGPGAAPSTSVSSTMAPEDDVAPGLFIFVLLFLLVIVLVGVAFLAILALAAGLLLVLIFVGILSTSAIAGVTDRSLGTAARWFIVQAAAAIGAMVGAVAALGAAAVLAMGVSWWIVLSCGVVSGGLSGGLVGWLFVAAAWGIVRLIKEKRALKRGGGIAGRFPVQGA